jgi:hypothetical protein
MKRREILGSALRLSGAGCLLLLGCGKNQDFSSKLHHDRELVETFRPLKKLNMFGYYQAFYGDQTIADLATQGEGTSYKMPQITVGQIYRGQEAIDIEFWHGHDQQHLFSVKRQHYAKLLQGQTVFIFTTLADGHWHCARITPEFEK